MQRSITDSYQMELDIVTVMQSFSTGGIATVIFNQQEENRLKEDFKNDIPPAKPQLSLANQQPDVKNSYVVKEDESAKSETVKLMKSPTPMNFAPSGLDTNLKNRTNLKTSKRDASYGTVSGGSAMKPGKSMPELLPVDHATLNNVVWRILWCFVLFVLPSIVQGWAMAPVFAENGHWVRDLHITTGIPVQQLTKSDITIRLGTWELLLMLPVYHLSFCGAVAAVALIFKWILIGRYHNGSHDLWSWYFCRCKLVEYILGFANTCFGAWFAWTPMLCAWYRLLGAHIGSDVSIGQVEIRGGFDLVEIGSNSYLEDAIDLTAGGVCWDGKNVVCGPIVLKERAVVLERAVILPGSVRQADCFVGVRELVDSAGNDTDASVLRPEVRPGIEEPFNGQADKATMVTLHATCLTSSLYAFGYILLVIVFELCIFTAVTALDEINIMMDYYGRKALYFFPVFIAVFSFSIAIIAIVAKWLVLGRITVGKRDITPWLIWRFWFIHALTNLSNRFFAPFWIWSWVMNLDLTLLGASIDLQSTNVSDMTFITTQVDLLSIGGNTFVAGRVSLRCLMVDNEQAVVEFASTSVGRGGYVGNSSVVCPRVTMADLVMVADFAIVRTGTTLLELSLVSGNSRVISLGVARAHSTLEEDRDMQLSKKPKCWFMVARVLLTIYLFCVMAASMVAGFEVMFRISKEVGKVPNFNFFDSHKFFGPQPAQFCFMWRPVVATIQLLFFFCAIMLHKWLLIGRASVGRDSVPHDMDSMFLITYLLCTNLWQYFCMLATPFAGTPVMSFMFRMMGANVGSDVMIFSPFVLCDHDAFTFEDSAYFGEGVFMQCHSFLNGGLLFGPIKIGKGAVVVGCNTVFVSDTTLDAESTVGPNSTVMRHAIVPQGEYWQGNPAKRKQS